MYDLRLFLSKKGRIKFVSHLDMFRMMQRTVRRADIPLWYTEGFNPHPYMTFLMPLPLGQSGMKEPLDIRIEGEMSFGEIKKRLNSVMPEGIEIVDVAKPEHKPNEIDAAEYELDIRFEDAVKAEAFSSGAEKIIEGGVLNAEKRSKKGIKTVNLCELVRSFEATAQGETVFIKTVLAAGNTVNLNAELLLNALLSELSAEDIDRNIVRTKLLREDLSIFE
jgi:radical SAM-linked protein